jgi:uncharacterized protein (DUF433 family)
MSSVYNQQVGVNRTERGLVVAGTRITLYQFMDYLDEGNSPESFRHYFPQITDEQFDAAISYIRANYTQVQAEYEVIVKEDDEIRRYWEEQNRDCLAQIGKLPPPGREVAWAKLQVHKAKLEPQL